MHSFHVSALGRNFGGGLCSLWGRHGALQRPKEGSGAILRPARILLGLPIHLRPLQGRWLRHKTYCIHCRLGTWKRSKASHVLGKELIERHSVVTCLTLPDWGAAIDCKGRGLEGS